MLQYFMSSTVFYHGLQKLDNKSEQQVPKLVVPSSQDNLLNSIYLRNKVVIDAISMKIAWGCKLPSVIPILQLDCSFTYRKKKLGEQ